MSDLSNYAEKLLLDWLLTGGAATRPTAWYLAAHTGDPGEDGSANELAGDGYARQPITFGAAATPGGVATSSNGPVFGPATGAGWGSVTHISIWDAVSGGNCLAKRAMTAAKTIDAGDNLQFPTGSVTATLA